MNKYLLLRDNKQSGPYSVPELIEKGIKAYDLVWLDGKSAAWRYPSEIDELKAYAPIVEEQPFDRFYKKQSPEKHFGEIVIEYSTQKIEIPVTASTVRAFEPTTAAKSIPREATPEIPELVAKTSVELPIESTTAKSSDIIVSRPAEGFVTRSPFEPKPQDGASMQKGQRIIYVTLPVSKTASRSDAEATKSSSPVSPSEKITERPVPAARDDNRDEKLFTGRSEANQGDRFTPAPKYKKVDADYKKTELAEKSFSSKFAGADLLTDTFYSGKAKKFLFAFTGKQNGAFMIIGALCLLLGGIIIGLAISNGKKESAKDLNNLVKQIQDRERLKQLPASQPVAKNDIPVTTIPEQNLSGNEQQPVNQKPNKSESSRAKLAVNNANSKKDKKSDEPVVQAIIPDDQPITIQPAVEENTNQSSTAAESTRKNIRQLVSVKSNKYKTGVLGGISDLSLTVSNNSDFEIDQVEVEVAYLGPEKRVIKTQIIVFNNIKPGSQLTQEVPRTNRGVSVTTNIKLINSRSLGLVQSGI